MNRGMNGGMPNLGAAAMLAARPQQQAVPMSIASPINDVQLVALLAAQLNGSSPVERVSFAQKILVEAICSHDKFHAALKERQPQE